ncbi:hypothetical protein NX868_30755, partial [Burkholderia thailandensis]|uniref:hypothetical protein n=1 Tax=Burkholderia thailandensis TaxID=57975 RepID=UPI00217D7A4E
HNVNQQYGNYQFSMFARRIVRTMPQFLPGTSSNPVSRAKSRNTLPALSFRLLKRLAPKPLMRSRRFVDDFVFHLTA